jgi:short-subunit dehydrogenase
MIERKKGSIIGIGSFFGVIPSPYATAYSATKFGLNGLYRSLLDELSVLNYDEFINISCLNLGFIYSNDAFNEYLNNLKLPLEHMTLATAGSYVIKSILNKTKFEVYPFSTRISQIVE